MCQRLGLCLLLISILPLKVSAAAPLREDIGVLKIHDLLLRPNFVLREPQQGLFSVGESSFALRWELEDRFAGVLRIGPRSLLNTLGRYDPAADEDDVTLVEAFGEYKHPYGRFRMGRLPVEFGYEGQLWERSLIFPRSLLFQQKAMMLRDVGVSYEVSHNNFFTGFVVHSGESDSDKDGRTWYTARWGYRTEKFEVGLSGQTGSTKPSATAASADTLAGVDPNREAKWRIAGLHGVLHKRTWQWIIEFYLGEREQETKIGHFNSARTDLSFDLTKTFSAHIRYDQFDPNGKMGGDTLKDLSIALMLSNETHSSNFILVGTHKFEQDKQVSNDELRLIWSLSPSGIVRF